MFKSLKAKLQDAGTISRLCELAEAHARSDRQSRPGAEHFLLAALDLDDGTARTAFRQVGIDPSGLKDAIERQYADALGGIGLETTFADGDADEPDKEGWRGLYQVTASGQEVMQLLAADRHAHAPLLGAHVVAIIAGLPHGVAARAIRHLGADLTELKSAAEAVANQAPEA